MTHISPRAIPQIRLARLLISTALIGAAPVIFLPASAAGQTFYLDNQDQSPDSGINPGSGTWAADSEIWSDADGNDHDRLPNGATAVLRPAVPADPGDAPVPVELDIDGTVRPGTIVAEGQGFTLRGGQIGTRTDEVTFEVSQDVTLSVTSDLGGRAIVAGNGMVYFTGTHESRRGLTVRDAATLRSTGETSGRLTIEDTATADLRSVHDGDVVVTEDARLISTGQIQGDVDLAGTGQLAGRLEDLSIAETGRADITADLQVDRITGQQGDLRITSGSTLDIARGTLTNAGNLFLLGDVTFDGDQRETTNTGTVVLQGGSLAGGLVNREGGTLRFGSDAAGLVSTEIGGDLTNEGEIDVAGADPMALDLGDATFINRGQVGGAGGGTLRILANLFALEEGSTLDLGAVELIGRIQNNGTLLVTAARQLTDDLLNDEDGLLTVSDQLDANGHSITNSGTLRIQTDAGAGTAGSVVNLDQLTSDGRIEIGAGTQVQADDTRITETGTLEIAGRLDSALQIDGSAQTTLQEGGTIAGAVTNAGTLRGAGRIEGVVTNLGDLTVTGDLGLSELDNTGTVLVEEDGILRSGADIENRGRIDLNGTLDIATGSGRLVNRSGQDVNLNGGRLQGDLFNEAGGTVDLAGTSTIAGDVNNSGTLQMSTAGEASLELEGGTFTNAGLVTSTAGGRLTIIADRIELLSDIDSALVRLVGLVVNAAGLDFTTDTVLSDDLNNAASGRIRVMADVDADGFAIRNEGEFLVGDNGNDGNLTGVSTFDNLGDLTIGRGSALETGVLSNHEAATTTIAGEVSGEILNAEGGELVLDQGLITGLVRNSGTLTGEGEIAAELRNSGTAMLAGSAGMIANSGTLGTLGDLVVGGLNNTGEVTVGTDHNLSVTDLVQNRGTAIVQGQLTGSVLNAADGTVEMQGGRLAGALDNRGTLTGRGTLEGVTNTGSLLTSGRLDADLIENSGQVTIAGGTELLVSDRLDNTGDLTVDGTLTGYLVNRTGGEADIAASGRVSGAITNDGVLTSRGTLDGTLTNNSSADLAGRVTAVANSGDLQITGPLQAGSVSSSGSIEVDADAVLQVADALDSSGVLTVNGRITTRQGLTNLGQGVMAVQGGVIAGAVHNTRDARLTMDADSRIDGALSNDGDAALAGRTGDLTNSGTLSVDGQLQVADLDNRDRGRLTIGAGDRLTASGQILNSATMQIAGSAVLQSADAALTNDGNLTLSGAQVTGNVVNHSRLTVDASSRIAGNLDNRETLAIASDSQTDLDLSGFTFRNSGRIIRQGDGTARILADLFLLRQGSEVDTALVELVGRIDNAGQFLVTTATRLTDTLTNRDTGITRVSAQLDAGGHNIVNDGTLVIAADPDADPDAGHVAEIVNAGGFVSGGRTEIAAGTRLQAGSARVSDGGQILIGGRLESGLRTDQGGEALLQGGTITGAVDNDGLLQGAGSIEGRLTNSGELHATGLLDLAGLDNMTGGLVRVDSGAQLRSASDIANAGQIDLSGTLQAGLLRNLTGARVNFASGRLEGEFQNDEGGVVTLSGQSAVSGNVTNSGTLQMTEGGTASLAVEGGTFTNRGTVVSRNRGRLMIIAENIILESPISNRFVELIGRVLNVTRLDYDQDARLSAELNNGEAGIIGVYADLDAAGFDVTNDGTLQVGDDTRTGQLRNIDTLTNSDGLNIAQGSQVAANQTANSATGVMTVAGTLTGDLSNAEGGQIGLTGGTIDGTLSNAGDLSGTGTITGLLDNSGSARLGGQAGAVVNSGDLSTIVELRLDTLSSTGSLAVGSGSRLVAGSTIDNRGTATIGGTLQGDMYNRITGRLDLSNGTVTGNVVNEGQAQMRGTVGGQMTNTGQLTTTGNLRLGALENSGGATVAAGHVLTAGGGVTNSGDLVLNGALTGSLGNQADGTTTLGSGSAIDGPVDNAGTLRGTGTISGPLTNSGTAQLAGSTGALTNSGSLQVTGALQTGSLTNSGQVAVGADQALSSTGAVTNSGTIALGGRLTAGDGVLNAAGGVLSLDGATVAADVTNAADGRIDIVSDSSITGDLTNRGVIDMTGTAPDVTLSVQNGSFTNSGTVQVSGTGFLTIAADEIVLEDGSQVDNSRVDLIGAVSNEGDLVYRRDAVLEGDLRNGTQGRVRVLAGLDGAGRDIVNNGSLIVGQTGTQGAVTGLNRLVNAGEVQIGTGSTITAASTLNSAGGAISLGGTLGGDLDNAAGAELTLAGGTIGGTLRNDGALRGDGTIDGRLINTGTAVIGGRAGAVTNSGMLQTGGDLTVAGLDSSGQTLIDTGHRLTSGGTVNNSGALAVAGVLDGSLRNTGTLTGSGQITGSVESRSQLTWTGSIGGGLLSTDVAQLSGSVGGDLRNEGEMRMTGDLSVAGTIRNAAPAPAGPASTASAAQTGPASAASAGIAAAGDRASLTVSQGTVLSTGGGIVNDAGAVLVNDGRIVGNLDNRGEYLQSGALTGSVATRGDAQILGNISGDLDYVSGQLTLAEGVQIGGNLTLRQDYTLAAGASLGAARTGVAEDATLSLGGRLNGGLLNEGVVAVSGDQASVSGVVTNNGRLDLTGGDRVGDVLQVGGLSGDGVVHLDVDLSNLTADRIEVRGGAVDGTVRLEFNQASVGTVSQPGRRVTLLDVDEAFAAENIFDYSVNSDFAASERIVFSVEQMPGNGNLTLVSQTNPAIGALFGNVALTQSLIGSVVNRPTSPFVTGLAFEGAEKPCGVGAWGRMTGGTATAEGGTDNGISRVNSEISATYYGLQVGSDLACFDGRVAGWDTAFGVLGGVNRGSTSQPIYAIDGRNSQDLSSTLSSVTKADFTQGYAGVYATATKGRMQADLQFRHELTDFNVSNRAVSATGGGLGLEDADFSSSANTLSGSFSYVVPLGEDSGWSFVPTAGFAWSKLSTDAVRFADDYRLSFDDSERRIGFVGGTLARTYVQPQQNTALYTFATTTFYKDFADATVSVFSNDTASDFEAQRLVSDNLGAYGELSIGANFIKIMGEGSRARQFSTSARLDARYGESLDSIGVTGQVRWQF